MNKYKKITEKIKKMIEMSSLMTEKCDTNARLICISSLYIYITGMGAELYDEIWELCNKEVKNHSITQDDFNYMIGICSKIKTTNDMEKIVEKFVADQNKYKGYSVLIPIYNLIISPDIKREVKVFEGTFIAREKIPQIRKRLGFPMTISHLNNKGKKIIESTLDKNVPTYLHLFIQAYNEDNAHHKAIKKAKELICLLTTIQFGETKRHRIKRFGKIYHNILLWPSLIIVDRKDKKVSINRSRYNSEELVIDKHIISDLTDSQHFFIQFLKISTRKNYQQISQRISGVLQLIGKSLLSNQIDEAFLYNMVALETLLKDNTESTETMVNKIESLLHWVKGYKFNRDIFESIYKKRCALVHDGDWSSITCDDIVYLDNILFNILNSILQYPKEFGSKPLIREFTEKYFAYKTLGKTMRLLPKYKKLFFLEINYNKKDYELLNNYFNKFI